MIVFLDVGFVLGVHADVLAHSEGLSGVRSPTGLASAVDAPINHHHYDDLVDLHELGELLMARLIANHPFVDANKRTGTFSMLAFLEANNARLALPMHRLLRPLEELAVALASPGADRHAGKVARLTRGAPRRPPGA